MSRFQALSPASRAIVLMIAAIFCFTAMDATAKALTPRVGLVPTLWARYAGQTLVVLVMVAHRMPGILKTRYPKLQAMRSAFLLVATGCFFVGIANIGLAQATAIMDVNPVLITLGAALFLKERLGPRRLFGIVAALIGAMIVIRPGGDVFSPYAIFPLVAAACYSGYALATRFVGRDEDVWTSLLYTGLFGSVVLSILLPGAWVRPDAQSLALMGTLILFGTLSQLLLIKALSQGEAGLIAPFAYAGLIFASIWGMIFFDEFPDLWTIIGALVIAGAGIYVWHRETRA
ncbi:Permease of the drug/metabolite transporter (DMT) superfamily [Salinihabitans flavidus]|uniref:Permease of the drug/metabolite transporter (DMT) superfamily n=1 Tax=Salinihabitans flavidus TaxID=569882 RepID=A0A1H8RNW5_9RHOB|nr:DMT family transporter [Salinihabitans flavidus]SEO67878.1 Permease of the drug/metabolite transporter (DMT) superfamily [Salinihabitans flavidus]